MKPQEFVSALRQAMIEDALDDYRGLLGKHSRKTVKNRAWKEAFCGWDSLNEQQRKAVLQLLRLAIVDTISHFCGVLDNTSPLENYRDGFTLLYGSKKEELSGDLQDYFLEAEEKESKKND